MQPQDEPEGTYERLRAHYIEEGRREGYERGLREGYESARRKERREVLLAVYAARFGEVPPAIAATVNAETDDATLFDLLPLFATGSADQIAAALAAPRRP